MARTTGRTGEVSGVNESTTKVTKVHEAALLPHSFVYPGALCGEIGDTSRRKVGRYNNLSRTVYGCNA